ncbi:MAG: hypothetical protein QF473_37720 [Planctomycetota bacterium]|nr:hypothetical protein [Planctomycetota bacterium]
MKNNASIGSQPRKRVKDISIDLVFYMEAINKDKVKMHEVYRKKII